MPSSLSRAIDEDDSARRTILPRVSLFPPLSLSSRLPSISPLPHVFLFPLLHLNARGGILELKSKHYHLVIETGLCPCVSLARAGAEDRTSHSSRRGATFLIPPSPFRLPDTQQSHGNECDKPPFPIQQSNRSSISNLNILFVSRRSPSSRCQSPSPLFLLPLRVGTNGASRVIARCQVVFTSDPAQRFTLRKTRGLRHCSE